MKRIVQLVILLVMMVSGVFAQKTSELWLDDLPVSTFSEGIPSVNVKANGAGEPMQLGATAYQRGLGIHSTGVLYFLLERMCGNIKIASRLLDEKHCAAAAL